LRASLTLTLWILSAGAYAQPLGTLFHSPTERDALDRQRRGEPAEKAASPGADPVITGYVKRSDGRSTVFLDGNPHPAHGLPAQQLLDPRIVNQAGAAPPRDAAGPGGRGKGP